MRGETCHPLQRIPCGRRWPVLLVLLISTGALIAVMSRTLRGERYGIVDLELARPRSTPARSSGLESMGSYAS
jgi:hypothetical protein